MSSTARYYYTSFPSLPKVLELLQIPTVASLNEEQLTTVKRIQLVGNQLGFITYPQARVLGGIWKKTVNNDEYVHWDWWPSGQTHSLLKDDTNDN